MTYPDPNPWPPPPSGPTQPWPGHAPLPAGWVPNPAYGPIPPAGPAPDGGYPWGPGADPNRPTPPAPRTPHGGQRRGGIIGGLLAAGLAFLKYGFALFKFGKFGATALTMLIAVVSYSLFFGWQYAVGVVVLIFVHEMGHFLTSKFEGIPVSAPVFLPFLGAFTSHAGLENDRRKEAVIAIAGPVFGFAATLLVYLYALSQPEVTHFVGLCFALAYFGFLITLFNLIPMVPLDGGRVAGALSKWANVAGLGIFAGVILLQFATEMPTNPFLILMFVIGCYTTWGRFQRAKRGEEPPPLSSGTRAGLAVWYVGLVALSAVLMSVSHGTLNNSGFVVVS